MRRFLSWKKPSLGVLTAPRGAAGAKIGAALGALTGPFAPITAPIFAIAGGVIGSYTGDSLFRYLVDISYLEE